MKARVSSAREVFSQCTWCAGRGRRRVLNGLHFRRMRQAAKVTLTEMARVCGVSHAHLSRMELGRGVDFLPRFAELYDRLFERRRRAGLP